MAELLLPPDLLPDAVRPLSNGRTVRMGGSTMGTDWSLSAVIEPQTGERHVRSILEGVFARVIAQMSQWDPDSELSRFNGAEPGTRHAVSPQFRIVLDCALQIAEASEGAFDPTLGHLSEAWGFGVAPAPAAVPAAASSANAGWRRIEWDHGDAVLIQPGGLQLDLSGIAKGFAVDMGVAALERIGIGHALLEIGGELRGIGVQADGLPWWVDVEAPPGLETASARIGLCGWSVATSGNFHRRREAEGRSWSHTLDPRTGVPLGDTVLSATVLHPGCMQADALATAIMVLGPERGMGFASRHGIPARLAMQSGTTTSPAWQRWLN
ncbi:FAD:protein FMN transferase [Altericroceibacterium xinjiangense]|uniref:FAD:protein FMN transferase n=1 Tax=Altericroceibacterium xinjiangense TaxID=762261 RepID=UPI001F499EEC|nr:FAD:protein FMN transferase [Altericroceibacterium xinjiangense]